MTTETTAETKITLSQLIQLALVLSDTKKGEAADHLSGEPLCYPAADKKTGY